MSHFLEPEDNFPDRQFPPGAAAAAAPGPRRVNFVDKEDVDDGNHHGGKQDHDDDDDDAPENAPAAVHVGHDDDDDDDDESQHHNQNTQQQSYEDDDGEHFNDDKQEEEEYSWQQQQQQQQNHQNDLQEEEEKEEEDDVAHNQQQHDAGPEHDDDDQEEEEDDLGRHEPIDQIHKARTMDYSAELRHPKKQRTAPFFVQPEKLLRAGDVSNTAVVKSTPVVSIRPRRGGDSSVYSQPGDAGSLSSKYKNNKEQQKKKPSAVFGASSSASSASPSAAAGGPSPQRSPSASLSMSKLSSSAGNNTKNTNHASSSNASPLRAASPTAFHNHRKRIEKQLAALEQAAAAASAAASSSSSRVVVPHKLRRVSPYRSGWCQYRPTDEDQLAHAEQVILSPLRGRYLQQNVCGLNTLSFTPPTEILDALMVQLQQERADALSPNASSTSGRGLTPVRVRHLVFVHGMGGAVGTWLPQLKHFADLADLLNSSVVFGNDEQEDPAEVEHDLAAASQHPNNGDPLDLSQGSNLQQNKEEQEQEGGGGGAAAAATNTAKKIFELFLGEIDEAQRQKLVHQRQRRELFIVHAVDLPGYGRSERPDVDFSSAYDSNEFMLERLSLWGKRMEFENVALWLSMRLPKVPVMAARKKKKKNMKGSSKKSSNDHHSHHPNTAANGTNKNKNSNEPLHDDERDQQQQQHHHPGKQQDEQEGEEELRDASSVRRAANSERPDRDRHHYIHPQAASSVSRRRGNSPTVAATGGGDGRYPPAARRDSSPVLYRGSVRSNASSNNSAYAGSDRGSSAGGGSRGSRSHTPAKVRIGGAPFQLLSDRRAAKLLEAEEESGRSNNNNDAGSNRRMFGGSSTRHDDDVDDDEMVDCQDDVFNEKPPPTALAAAGASSFSSSRDPQRLPPLSPAPPNNPRFILPDSPDHLDPHPAEKSSRSNSLPPPPPSGQLPRPGSPGYAAFLNATRGLGGRHGYSPSPQKQQQQNNSNSDRRRSSPAPIGVIAARHRSERVSNENFRASSLAASSSASRRELKADRHELDFEPPLGVRCKDEQVGENGEQFEDVEKFSNVTVAAHSYGAFLFGQLACWENRFHKKPSNAPHDDDDEDEDEDEKQDQKSNNNNKKKITADWLDHLVLLDPWGLPPQPAEDDTEFQSNLPCLIRCLNQCATCCDVLPLSAMRNAGPYGPSLLPSFRGDFTARWEGVVDDSRVFTDYVYHCNAQDPPTGERAIKRATGDFGFSSDPLAPVLMDHCPDSLHVSLVYGDKTFMAKDVGFEVTEVLRARRKDAIEEGRAAGIVQYGVVPASGHQLNTDNVFGFNCILQALLRL